MKYVHTNIIAHDLHGLTTFYQDALGCTLAQPERELTGAWVDAMTGMEGARILCVHLHLPGYGDAPPILEFFHYDTMPKRPRIELNTPGITHLAFQVHDVARASGLFVECGGSAVGELVTQAFPDGKTLTVQYMADPEGNFVELNNWKD